MPKIYVVRLSDAERQICLAVIKKFQGSPKKVRRAHILLQGDERRPLAQRTTGELRFLKLAIGLIEAC